MTPTLPAVPNDPTTRSLTYDDPAEVSAAIGGWRNRDAARDAQAAADAATIADLRAQVAALTPVVPIKWGSSVYARPGVETYDQALARTVGALNPDFIRTFLQDTSPLVWPTKNGSLPCVLSIRRSPADVIAGKCDAEITALANSVPSWATPSNPARLCYSHEPEKHIAGGEFTSKQYKDAWARVASLVRATGKPIELSLILMGYTLDPASGRNFDDYDPGSAVDVYAFDVYWHPGKDAAHLYDAARAIGVAKGKPWAVAETSAASNETTPAQRAQVLHDLAYGLATVDPKPVYASAFDSNNDPAFQYLFTTDAGCVNGWNTGRTGN